MIFVLDTNILIHLIRQTPNVQDYLNQIGAFDRNNYMNISIVSVAEIKTFAYRNKWGDSKIATLNTLVRALNPIAIDNQNIVDAYVEIDLFSQGKHAQHLLPKGTSARAMGKNDIWIAATTYFLEAQLVTTDADFLHLDSVFFDIAHTVVV